MSRTITFEDEEFALIRGNGVSAGLVNMYARITVSDFDRNDWLVSEIGVRAYRGNRNIGWEQLQPGDDLYKAIHTAIEDYAQEQIAELIAEAFEPDPDYLRDMRDLGTLNSNQQFGRTA